MESIDRERQLKTPKINFNYETGILLLEGVSIPENTVDFYSEPVQWLKDYVEKPKDKTVFDVKLEYFNTSTSVILLNLFRLLAKLVQNSDLVINWYFEEDDIEMDEAGQDYAKMMEGTGTIFNIIEVDSFD